MVPQPQKLRLNQKSDVVEAEDEDSISSLSGMSSSDDEKSVPVKPVAKAMPKQQSTADSGSASQKTPTVPPPGVQKPAESGKPPLQPGGTAQPSVTVPALTMPPRASSATRKEDESKEKAEQQLSNTTAPVPAKFAERQTSETPTFDSQISFRKSTSGTLQMIESEDELESGKLSLLVGNTQQTLQHIHFLFHVVFMYD